MNAHVKQEGGGCFFLLGIVFVTLKLVGVIDWSWWLVTLPFWGGLALIAIVGTLVLLGFSVYTMVSKR